jgi:SRSO17 transposase
MVKEHIDNGVHFDYVNGDGLYGNGYTFSKGVDALGKKYVLDVHCNQQIYLQRLNIRIPEAPKGQRGPKPKLRKPDLQGISVAEYKLGLRNTDYKEVKIRPTTKGWLKAQVHIKKVWVWDESAGDMEPIEQTLIIRKPLNKKDKAKYSLSNIKVDEQNIEMFVFMQAQRFWIERCFRDDSHDLGMSDYQVRTYKGFNNHMALTCVAMQYVLRERMKNSKEVPLLSYNDIRIILASNIRQRADYDCNENRMEQLSKRHKQRAKDIFNFY